MNDTDFYNYLISITKINDHRLYLKYISSYMKHINIIMDKYDFIKPGMYIKIKYPRSYKIKKVMEISCWKDTIQVGTNYGNFFYHECEKPTQKEIENSLI